jgi:hypothetical protein
MSTMLKKAGGDFRRGAVIGLGVAGGSVVGIGDSIKAAGGTLKAALNKIPANLPIGRNRRSVDDAAPDEDLEILADLELEDGPDEGDEAQPTNDGGVRNLTTLEEEVLVSSLVDTEELGPAVRAVYDRGVEQSFAKALGRFRKEKEAEILEACGQQNALDFIASVDAVLTVQVSRPP